VAGLAVGFLSARHPPRARVRRNGGRALVIALAAVPVVALLVLARAPGGVDGQLSKAWHDAVSPQAHVPANTPQRLTATASVRARYSQEALKNHGALTWRRQGAGSFATVRTRVRENGDSVVRHAHGYVVQTLSDL